jgi:glucosamine--fructose-6-phosphate aminotransferase (isomerizing)
VDDRFFEIAYLPKGMLFEKAVSNVQEVLARNGHVIAITNEEKFDLPVEHVVKIGSDVELFAPLLMNLVAQLFAYYATVAKGLNVDQPRNLAKSVTVE